MDDLKTIVIHIHEIAETITFSESMRDEQLVEVLRSAARAGPADYLLLRATETRAIVPIVTSLPENTASTPYILTVVPYKINAGVEGRTGSIKRSSFTERRLNELRDNARPSLSIDCSDPGYAPAVESTLLSSYHALGHSNTSSHLNLLSPKRSAIGTHFASDVDYQTTPTKRDSTFTSFGLSFTHKPRVAQTDMPYAPSDEKRIDMSVSFKDTDHSQARDTASPLHFAAAMPEDTDTGHPLQSSDPVEMLRAEARRVREKELADMRPRYLIRIDSMFAKIWTAFYLTAIVIDVFVIPFSIAFPDKDGTLSAALILSYALDVVLVADIILRFQWEAVDGRRRIEMATDIRRHYRRGQFRWDAFGVAPFDIIALAYGGVFLLPLLRLNRLVNLPKVVRYFRVQENDIKRETGMIRVRMYAICGLMIMHILACIWHIISCHPVIGEGRIHCSSKGWLISSGHVEFVTSKLDAYVVSFYWTVCSMTSVGYGDIIAGTNLERIYACIVMVLGVCLFSFIMGNIASAVASADAMRADFRHKVRTVREYMAYHDIRPKLQHEVEDFYVHEWYTKNGVDTSFYNSLPDAFRSEIALEINRKQLLKVPLFQDCNEDILKELALRMRPVSLLADKYVIRRGEDSRDIFFLMEGLVRIISEEDGTVYAEQTKGSFFGEVGVLFDLPRTATVVTATHCDMFLLSKRDLLSVVAKFEPLRDKLDNCAGERLTWFKTRRYVDTGNDFGGNLEIEMNVENLRKVDLFRDCGENALLRELASSMETITYEPGDMIIRKGSIGHEMFFINRGSAVITGDSDKQVFATVSEGAYFGEIGILFCVPRSANVRAVSHCHLMVLFKEMFDLIMAKYPTIRERIMDTANKRLNKTAAPPTQPSQPDKSPLENDSAGAGEGPFARTLRRMSNIGPAIMRTPIGRRVSLSATSAFASHSSGAMLSPSPSQRAAGESTSAMGASAAALTLDHVRVDTHMGEFAEISANEHRRTVAAFERGQCRDEEGLPSVEVAEVADGTCFDSRDRSSPGADYHSLSASASTSEGVFRFEISESCE
eukprot:Opistho-2@2286